MDKNEYSHLHGYQDVKDAFNEKLIERSKEHFKNLWTQPDSIQEALSESLCESNDFAYLVTYCHRSSNAALLGEIMMEMISRYLSDVADELAEDDLSE